VTLDTEPPISVRRPRKGKYYIHIVNYPRDQGFMGEAQLHSFLATERNGGV